MKKILILSPHSDDAVLSCADHISYWKKMGYSITVCRIFTKYETNILSTDAKRFIEQSGCNDVISFEKTRTREDINALTYLKVSFLSQKYTDSAFRTYKNNLLYNSFNKLLNGRISDKDTTLMQSINTLFSKLADTYDFVIAPLAIGNHVDHKIINICANKSIQRDKLFYYLDAPYFFSLSNWNFNLLKIILLQWESLRMTTTIKRKAIDSYTSQKNFLFKSYRRFFFNSKIQYFPEIILNINNNKGIL